MRNNETGEFELVVGNRQLLSGFFIVVLLFAVAFAMGYIFGQNSPRSARLQPEARAPRTHRRRGRPRHRPLRRPQRCRPGFQRADRAAGARRARQRRPRSPPLSRRANPPAAAPPAGPATGRRRAAGHAALLPSGAGLVLASRGAQPARCRSRGPRP